MTPHLRYLRYVLLHKWYVLRAGLLIRRHFNVGRGWLWRLLVHDLSKFRPSEWRPYVAYFYGDGFTDKPRQKMTVEPEAFASKQRGERQAQFNRAWLLHLHRNDHHWQHWILHEDSGKTIVQLMPSNVALEMLADWIGAGTKVLKGPSMAECIAETVVWYAANYQRMMIRGIARAQVEQGLLTLNDEYVPIADRPAMPLASELVTFVP